MTRRDQHDSSHWNCRLIALHLSALALGLTAFVSTQILFHNLTHGLTDFSGRSRYVAAFGFMTLAVAVHVLTVRLVRLFLSAVGIVTVADASMITPFLHRWPSAWVRKSRDQAGGSQ